MLQEEVARNTRTDLSRKRLVKEGIGSFGCFIFMFVIFNPLELYSSNINEFNFTFKNFVGMILCVGGLSIVLMCGIISVIPLRLGRIAVIAVSMVDILFYIQYFINGRMGLLDGTDHYSVTECYVNYAIWVIIIGIVIGLMLIVEKRTKKGVSYISYIPYAIMAMQLVACISLVSGLKNINSEEEWIFTNKDELKVSSSENVLILVLDCFSNEVIPQLETEYPESLECLKDFVYFDNANSVYEATFMSLAYILTGTEYDTTCSYLDWGDNAWGSEYCENVYNILKENNYKVKIFSSDVLGCRNPENIAQKIDNYQKVEIVQSNINYLMLMKVFLKSSFYKYLPIGLKQHFYISDEMFNENVNLVYSQSYEAPIKTNYDYYSVLVNEGLSIDGDTNGNYFIMEHLRGLHPPYGIDENCVHVEDGERIPAARGCMLIVDEYIRQLKELGVYDNSTIIVMSDHGNQGQCQGVQPIFFIKERNMTRDEMQICSSPISYEDIMPTVLKEITGGGV